ncbi:cytochrome P450 3A28-like [Mizuhopecten yessoensis]|uniref:Cytochrome P450 3A28 n=1 Tax=Mizuhopecten yessoensis TaxID=6573 RepID=A0A210R416_MIZYE|nr:cytochrome P450 3A28-like [Mizuhopecten yessoensis]OWF55695.1 Cytochrome P450 3A28 [Mizuhopecten yessoensis]
MAAAVVNILVHAVLYILKYINYLFYRTTIPETGSVVKTLLHQLFGDDKLKKLEYLCQFYHKYGLYRYEGKIYLFEERIAQTAINKLDKGADNYLEDSPLKDTFLGSSQKSPETRRAIASIFRKTSIDERGQVMIRDLDLLCQNIREVSSRSRPVNITQFSLRLALDVVGHVLLHLDLGGLNGRQDRLLDAMMTILHRCYALAEITSNSTEFIQAAENLDSLTSQILEDALNEDDQTGEDKRLVVQLHEACGFEQAKDNMKLFLMAGTETTASTLPVVFYLLTKYPHVQMELQAEADENIDNLRKDPNFPLPKIESVMKEVLRLYPIAPFISRQNNGPITIGKVNLQEHSDLLVFTWGIHRSPHAWSHSTEFIPFRFYENESKKSTSNLYIPFGAGSRVCIGQHLAWLEIRLAIAILLNNFDFSQVEETPDLRFVVDWTHAVVHPDKDMVFRAVPRTTAGTTT